MLAQKVAKAYEPGDGGYTDYIGGQIRARLKRITSVGTAPSINPFATQLGIHIECDTLGSRAISTK